MRYVAHGYSAYVNKISFAYPEHLVHGGVAPAVIMCNFNGQSHTSWIMSPFSEGQTLAKLILLCKRKSRNQNHLETFYRMKIRLFFAEILQL